jgi:kelch-like protein 2/3
LQVLLPAASLLQLLDVRQNCCDFLQSQLHPTNCLGIRAFADVHTCTDLLQQANAYAGNGEPSHCTSPELVNLITWPAVDALKSMRSGLCWKQL